MITAFIREEGKYSKRELKNILKEDDDSKLNDILNELLQMGYVSTANSQIKFIFVGVVVIFDKILKCYPKYITKNKAPVEELKQILKVLKKYSSADEQDIYKHNNFIGDNDFNMFSLMLFLFDDYYENGSYINKKEVYEKNGHGEISWSKTIDESFCYISKNKPYYFETYNKKKTNDDSDYFKRLHDCILSEISKNLNEMDLLDLFDLTPVDISDEELSDFGDNDYILNKLENELAMQYNTRKQELLHGLHSYITKKEEFENSISISSFATSNFKSVWENICQNVMESVLHEQIGELFGEFGELEEYENVTLFDYVEKPIWKKQGTTLTMKTPGTHELDAISLYVDENNDMNFIISDAKYYHYNIDSDENIISGQPGIEDIRKQYFYQIAYKDLIDIIKKNRQPSNVKVENLLLSPTENSEIETLTVSLPSLVGDPLNLVLIKSFLLPATEIYDLYLSNKANKLEIMCKKLL